MNHFKPISKLRLFVVCLSAFPIVWLSSLQEQSPVSRASDVFVCLAAIVKLVDALEVSSSQDLT